MKTFLALSCAILALLARPSFAGSEDDVRAAFERFVAAQNAHDPAAVGDLLAESASFLWISRGTPIWGRDAALKRFEGLYQGTWKLAPEMAALRIVMLSDTTAQLFIPIVFTIGPAGQPASDSTFLMNQTLVKGAAGWRIASILPIPAAAPAPPK